MQIRKALFVIMLFVLLMGAEAMDRTIQVLEHASPTAFPMVGKKTADIIYDVGDAKVVEIAARMLAEDVEQVTGKKPFTQVTAPDGSKPVVLVGTIGKSRAIDALIRSGKLDTAKLRGQWESFLITVVSAPFDGMDEALVIAGSDPRGTAYGIFTLAESIGVSPWHFMADVPVKQRAQLHIPRDIVIRDQPAVKYRGIFLNDEGWGLEPWASKTFEPEVGNIGPKTYGRIFELLLRLRANYFWPAMHPGTTPFHQVPGNAACADDYGIVVGSSHCEPMLRNNVREWDQPKEHFNYLTHSDAVLEYWNERVSERTAGESIFTLGMRGVHDGAIQGPRNQQERIQTLEKIFKDQRDLLAKYLGDGDPTRVAQMFCPYKEVLDDYLAGLKVPDDVTLVWPDDNFGYVRRYATPAERERKGGLGVYYHLSYLGKPLSWLWIDTQPPALIWAEMTRAYEQGARTLWVANVGDLKNTERSAEFFLDLAWHADRTNLKAPARFMQETAARDFGADYAEAIVDLLQRLQAISFERRAEHLQWHYSLEPYQCTELNEAEIHERLTRCQRLLQESEALVARLPADARDAYFELIGYAVGITEAANERYFRAELARADVARGRSPDANLAAAQAAEARVDQLTTRYNTEIAGGKWNHIVTENGVASKDWKRFQRDVEAVRPEPAPETVCPPPPPKVGPLPHPTGARSGDFVEVDGVVSIYAGHYTNQTDLKSGAGWRSVPGLGRTGSAVTVLPSSAEIPVGRGPSLDYRFYVADGGDATLQVQLLPTHPLVSGQGLHLAVAIDDGAPVPLAITSGFNPKRDEWKHRVLSNSTTVITALPEALKPGWHTLRLVAVDAGVVVDRMVIQFGTPAPSYNGPPETRVP